MADEHRGMKVEITFRTDSAAFDGDRWAESAEIERILRAIADHVSHGSAESASTFPVVDIDGNTVGKVIFHERD